MTHDHELVELELHTPDEHKLFRAERTGSKVVTRTGAPDKKGRSTTKDHGTAGKARAALAKAVAKKLDEGYFVVGEALPPPFEVDAAQVTADDRLQLVPLPASGGRARRLRGEPPVQLEQHRKRYGFHYEAGPGDSGLWFPGALHVGVRHFIRKVEPALRGKYSDFPFWYDGHPARPDERALLVGHGKTLYEVEIETARAAELHVFTSAKALAGASPFLYTADGEQILWCDAATVVALARGEGPRPVLELGDEPILAAARLASGAIAFLQESQLTVAVPAGERFTVTHAIECAHGKALGTWLGGRLLIAMGEQQTVVFGNHGDGLHPVYETTQPVGAAFDHRGAQWLYYGSLEHGSPYRVFNAEAAWRASAKGPAIAADHVIALAPLHDQIAAMVDKRCSPDVVRARVGRRPQLLEHRAYNGGSTPLGYAAWVGTQPIAELLLELGADLDAPGRDGRSPLAIAIERGHVELAEWLLARGAKAVLPAEVVIDDKPVRTESPLVAAARRGYHDLVVRMLDAGAAIDSTGHDGATAFYGAARAGHVELAKLLLARGAAVDAVVERGPAPLEAVVESRDPELVRTVAARSRDTRGAIGAQMLRYACLSLSVKSTPRAVVDALVEHGARTTTSEALHYAIEARHAGAVAAMIAAGASPNEPYVTVPKPSLPLQLAFFVADPDPDVVEALLAGGAAVDALDNRNVLALCYAAANCRDLALIRRLIEAGASLAPVGNAWGALHQAAWTGRLDVVDLLLDAGAPLDAVTAAGRSAVSMAAENGKPEVVRRLLARRAAPDAGTWTALMAAAIRNDEELVAVLLDAGADPTRSEVRPGAKDTTARTAQGHAEVAHATRAAALLAERTGGGYTTLHAAIAADDIDAARAMLDAGADVNEPRGDTRSVPLHAARSVAAIELLVERGAAIDGADREGATALHVAARAPDAGALERVEILLARGADATHRAKTGATALHGAAWVGNLAVARRLIDAGCPIEDRRKRVTQPLHIAARRNDVELARLLLDRGARVEPIAYDVNGGQETPLHLASGPEGVAIVELLLSRGADPAACTDSREGKSEAELEDEAVWSQGGYTPIHRAAERGDFAVLVALLRRDRRGARYLPTVSGKYAEELAEGHPRCQALLAALANAKTSVDAALAELAEREAATTDGSLPR